MKGHLMNCSVQHEQLAASFQSDMIESILQLRRDLSKEQRRLSSEVYAAEKQHTQHRTGMQNMFGESLMVCVNICSNRILGK